MNVVSNALEHSSGPVTIGARAHRGRVVVSVRDEGPGIAPDDLPTCSTPTPGALLALAAEGGGAASA